MVSGAPRDGRASADPRGGPPTGGGAIS